MSRHSPKEIERIKRIASKMTPDSLAQGSLAATVGPSDRVIIGESSQAGWPISAKVYHSDGRGDFGMPPIRWAPRSDNTFALESYVFGAGQWVEVPLWNTAPTCPKCGKPGVFIRERPFTDGSGKVYMCMTDGCENQRLYFYPPTL
jgi:hypothetical protein